MGKANPELLARLINQFSQPPELECVRTGVHALDLMMGDGLPIGRVVELYGSESSGKSLFAWHVAKAVQALDGLAILYDVEATAPRKFMERVGVDPKRIVYRRDRIQKIKKKRIQWLDTIEAIEDDIIRMLEVFRPTVSGPILVIWDSVASTTAEREWMIDKETKARVPTDKGYMADRARAISVALRRLVPSLAANRATLIAVNQLRHTLAMFGKKMDTPGGKGLKFHSSVRIEMSRRGRIELNGRKVGVDTHARIEKNKVSEPFREADLKIYWEHGFDPYSGLADLLVTSGRLRQAKKAGKYAYKNVVLSRRLLPKFIEKHPQLLEPWY